MNFDVQYESQYWFSHDVLLRMSESNGDLVNPSIQHQPPGEETVTSDHPVLFSLVNVQEREIDGGTRIFTPTPLSFADRYKTEDY